jgi:excisionase family DNA binding protein
MSQTIATAEELYSAMKDMPSSERMRFFTLLGQKAFEKESFTHEDVFVAVSNAEFTVSEAAEYLEVSVPTFRRYVQSKKITPVHIVGRNQFFATTDLKSFKRSLRAVKGH